MISEPVTKGDTGTPLEAILGDRSGPVDLTGATVVFRYSVAGVVTEKSLTPDADQAANRGKASAFWGATELDSVPAGEYLCQAKATLSTGRIRYFPNDGGFNVLVVREPL